MVVGVRGVTSISKSPMSCTGTVPYPRISYHGKNPQNFLGMHSVELRFCLIASAGGRGFGVWTAVREQIRLILAYLRLFFP